MKKLARSFFISLVAFYIVTQFMPGISFGGKNENLLLASFTFAAIAIFIKPFIKVILLPFNLVTFGAIGSFVNLGIIFLISFLLPFFVIGSFNFPGYEVLGFMIPPFTSNTLFTGSLLSIGVSLATTLLYYLLT